MRIFREVEAGAHGSDSSIVEEMSRLRANLAGVKSIVAIASARGGAGKSVLAVNVAAVLALAGRKVGLVDGDLNSPSLLAMLGMRPPRRAMAGEGMEPGTGPLGLRIASSNLIPDGEPPPMNFVDIDDQAANLNGVRTVEIGYLATMRRLLGQTRFGALDLMLVDLAPGMEALYRLARVAPRASAVIVTHTSAISSHGAKGAIELAAQEGIPVIGIVENMAGFNCDGCHSVRPLAPQGSVASVARESGVPVLERLPFDPRLAETSDRGVLFVRQYADTPLAKQIVALAHSIDRALAAQQSAEPVSA